MWILKARAIPPREVLSLAAPSSLECIQASSRFCFQPAETSISKLSHTLVKRGMPKAFPIHSSCRKNGLGTPKAHAENIRDCPQRIGRACLPGLPSSPAYAASWGDFWTEKEVA